MELNAFLESKKTSLGNVVSEATRLVDIPADEMLMAVGSLVEGLGTTASDLDLLLLSGRTAADLPDAEEICWVSGNCLVDMRILPGPIVEELLARFSTWSAAPWDPSRSAPFTLEQRTLLHRMAVGTELIRSAQPAAGRYARPDLESLARLKLHAARHEARTVQVDMVGLRDAGDYRSLAFAAAQLMHLAIDAILAGHRLTNPLTKWRSRLLDAIPGDWHAELGPRRSEPAGDTVWRLLRFPESHAAPDALRYAQRIAAYARATFAWAEDALLRPHDARGRIASVPFQPVATASPASLPFLDFDIDFSVDAQAVSLGRLNAFTEPLTISRAELAAALLFDGETGTEEADAWIAGRHAERVSSGSLRRRCADHGLLAVAFEP